MPIPTELIQTGNIFEEVMDPHERFDFTTHWVDRMDGTDQSILQGDIVLSPEAVALGVEVIPGQTTWEGTDMTAWFVCTDPENPAFDGDGVSIGVLWRIEDTRTGLSRKYERTMGLRLRQG